MAPNVHAKLLQHQKMLDPTGVSNAEILRANSYWWLLVLPEMCFLSQTVVKRSGDHASSVARLLRAAGPETFSQRGLVLMDPPYEPYHSFMAWNLHVLQFLESKWPSACVRCPVTEWRVSRHAAMPCRLARKHPVRWPCGIPASTERSFETSTRALLVSGWATSWWWSLGAFPDAGSCSCTSLALR